MRTATQRFLRAEKQISLNKIAKVLPAQVQRACFNAQASAQRESFNAQASGYESDVNWTELNPSDLTVTTIDKPSEFTFRPDLLFGERYSDHMLEADWTREDGWGAPQILPFGNLPMHPASSC